MATPRTLLARVRKLEQGDESPMLALLGGERGWERFQVEAGEGIAAGRYDSQDMPVVIDALRGWLGQTSADSSGVIVAMDIPRR